MAYRLCGVSLLTVCGWLLPTFATAQDAEVYDLNWPVDVGVTAVAAFGWALPSLFADDLVTQSCPCDSRSVFSLDRAVAGVRRDGVALASDVLIASVYGLGAVLDGADTLATTNGTVAFLQDLIVMGEAVTITGALTGLAKFTTDRPRPLLYDLPADDPALLVADNYTSFFSGHTAGAFAMGLSYAQTFALRHPQSPYRVLVYSAAIVLGSTVGALRVLSGRHFPTDVLAGAAVGSGVGLLVPWLHQRSQDVQLGFHPLPGGIALTVALVDG